MIRAAWRRLAGRWFPEQSTVRLALLRPVLLLAAVTVFTRDLDLHLELAARPGGFERPQLALRALAGWLGEDVVRSAPFLTAVHGTTVVAGILGAIGFLTPLTSAVAAIGFTTLSAHVYSYGEVHHQYTILALLLLALAGSDWGRSLSVDAWLRHRRRGTGTALGLEERSRHVAWPVELLLWLLAIAYLDAATSKLLRTGGIAWVNGYTLQTYLLQMAVGSVGLPVSPMRLWLASQHGLCQLLSVGVVCGQLSVVVAALVPRLRPVLVPAAFLLHLGLDLFFARASWASWWLLYAFFVPLERLPPLARAIAAAQEASRARLAGVSASP